MKNCQSGKIRAIHKIQWQVTTEESAGPRRPIQCRSLKYTCHSLEIVDSTKKPQVKSQSLIKCRRTLSQTSLHNMFVQTLYSLLNNTKIKKKKSYIILNNTLSVQWDHVITTQKRVQDLKSTRTTNILNVVQCYITWLFSTTASNVKSYLDV